MPLIEFGCFTDACHAYGSVREDFFHTRTQIEAPVCEGCGQPMVKLVSRFGFLWSGNLGDNRYQKKIPESLTGQTPPPSDGHWVMAKRTPDGIPRSEYITTRQQQREFCKREGLIDPTDMPSNSEVSADGRQLQWKGMPGSWL